MTESVKALCDAAEAAVLAVWDKDLVVHDWAHVLRSALAAVRAEHPAVIDEALPQSLAGIDPDITGGKDVVGYLKERWDGGAKASGQGQAILCRSASDGQFEVPPIGESQPARKADVPQSGGTSVKRSKELADEIGREVGLLGPVQGAHLARRLRAGEGDGMSARRCWPLMHEWSKWEVIDIMVQLFNVHRKIGEPMQAQRQRRQCERCGFVQQKRLG